MELTSKNKALIDSLSYYGLLSRWRNALVGDSWFQGETGDYWAKRMAELRDQPGGNRVHVSASKAIGWKKQ